MHSVPFTTVILLILQVKKKLVDTFEPGKRVPSCQLRLYWVGNEQPTYLCHQIDLIGAKEPVNYISVEFDVNSPLQPPPPPQSTTMESNQGLHFEALSLSSTCHKSVTVKGTVQKSTFQLHIQPST